MSDPQTLGDVMDFVAAQRPPFHPEAETVIFWLREACERALTAGQALTTPIANVDRLSGLYARLKAIPAM